MAIQGTWTYNGDPGSSAVNEVRFIIGDVVPDRPLFFDTEISFQLAKTPDPLLTGAELLEIKARQFARLADETVDAVSKSYSQVYKQMRQAAQDLRDNAGRSSLPFFGGLTHSGKRELDLDPDAVQPNFPIGLTDYPGILQLNRDIDVLIGLVGLGGI